MHNVEHKMVGTNLVITIDLSPKTVAAAPLSSTGKTKLVATTGGALAVPSPNGHAVTFALNVMAKGG